MRLRMRIVSGIQPSGKLHLGNYFGALRQFVAYQAEAEALYFIADLHALTSVQDGALLRQLSLDVALDYLACGLDPQRSLIFRQSDVSLHAELCWLLMTVTPMGLLERAHSYKDKTARGQAAQAALLTYPVLMAADILLYGADQVPVGQDQKQHLEIARDLCTKFNSAYVPGYRPQDPQGLAGGTPGIFKLPEALITPSVAQVPGIDGQKMSKSYHNTIDLFGEEKALRRRIMGIVTDSAAIEAPKPAGAPCSACCSCWRPSRRPRRCAAAGGAAGWAMAPTKSAWWSCVWIILPRPVSAANSCRTIWATWRRCCRTAPNAPAPWPSPSGTGLWPPPAWGAGRPPESRAWRRSLGA